MIYIESSDIMKRKFDDLCPLHSKHPIPDTRVPPLSPIYFRGLDIFTLYRLVIFAKF